MKEAFYFPHDNNAHNDPKLMTVFMKTGLSGVGLYWILVELLHQQDNGKIRKEEYDNYIKWYTGNENKGKTFVEQVLNIYLTTELFYLDNEGYIYSKRVLENKKYREELSEKRSEAGKKSALARQKSTSVEQNGTSVEQGKERKGKERKLKENTDTVVSQPNEYELSISYLKNIENEQIPDYAENYREEWIKFCYYWSEKGRSGKIRAEGEKTFEIKRRFATWIGRKKDEYQKEQPRPRGISV